MQRHMAQLQIGIAGAAVRAGDHLDAGEDLHELARHTDKTERRKYAPEPWPFFKHVPQPCCENHGAYEEPDKVIYGEHAQRTPIPLYL